MQPKNSVSHRRFTVWYRYALASDQGILEKCTQVVTNLVSNAVKYSPRGGEITISASLKPAEGNSSPVEDPLRHISRGGETVAGTPRAAGDTTDVDTIHCRYRGSGRVDTPDESEFVRRPAATERGSGRGGVVDGGGGGHANNAVVMDLSHPGTTDDAAASAPSASGATRLAVAGSDTMTPGLAAVGKPFSSSCLLALEGGAGAPANTAGGGAAATSTTGASHAGATATASRAERSESSVDLHGRCTAAAVPHAEDSAQGADHEGVRRLLVLSVQDSGLGINPEDLPRYGPAIRRSGHFDCTQKKNAVGGPGQCAQHRKTCCGE